MESQQQLNTKIFSSCDDITLSRNKNFIIAILLCILVLMFLGINVFNIFGSTINNFFQIFAPVVKQVLSLFGYTTGTVVNASSDLASNVVKSGIDVADGTLQDVGNLLKNVSDPNMNPESKAALHRLINESNETYVNQPNPDSATNPIQNPISSNKKNWCLVEEYEEKRNCVEIGEDEKCMSGQVFPNQKMCLNPTITP